MRSLDDRIADARAYGERHGIGHLFERGLGERRVAQGTEEAVWWLASWLEQDLPFGTPREPRCVVAAILRGEVVPVERDGEAASDE